MRTVQDVQVLFLFMKKTSDRLYSNQDDGTCTQVTSSRRSSEIQRVKPIHIPRALADGPFLQYPRLTPGQRCYLSSIASIYSTEHVRRLMQQHYLNVLYRCTQEDPCPFKESRSEEESMIGKECVQMDSDMTTVSRTPSRSSEDSSLVAVNAVALPKIPIKQARKTSRPLASKERKTRKPKKKVPVVQVASTKARKREADTSRRSEKTRAVFLSESMESLSIQE
ncbi:protein FAM216A-like isoform X2 [Anguilla anguilla]|uniref:protein FAM216A-like isoform X2 n=1 Tax=Anguilla anguilla TaxID=7936 RepID=UPI0015A860F8|nr:protein FAM216A-like isoform X2 [Anguilla anguilla]